MEGVTPTTPRYALHPIQRKAFSHENLTWMADFFLCDASGNWKLPWRTNRDKMFCSSTPYDSCLRLQKRFLLTIRGRHSKRYLSPFFCVFTGKTNFKKALFVRLDLPFC